MSRIEALQRDLGGERGNGDREKGSYDQMGEASLQGGLKPDLALRQRSTMEMLNTLNNRLKQLQVKSKERYVACKAQLQLQGQGGNSAETSSGAGENNNYSLPEAKRDGQRDGQPAPTDDSSPNSLLLIYGRGGVEEPSLAFRSAASSESGRKLESKFENELHASGKAPKSGIALGGIRSTKTRQNETHARRKQRIQCERILQSNLECFITRSVTDLIYTMPPDSRGNENLCGGDRSDCNRFSSEMWYEEPDLDPLASEQCEEAKYLRQETYPIPLCGKQMDPSVLVQYACLRATLPAGPKWNEAVLLMDSRLLFVHLFWYVHCRFFQKNSLREQDYLLRLLGNRYVKILHYSTWNMPDKEMQDTFHLNYPFIMANAVYWGFYYLCPGSRHLYSTIFKRILYMEASRLLSGVDVAPAAVLQRLALLFPGDKISQVEPYGEGIVDALPPITKSKRVEGMAGQKEKRETECSYSLDSATEPQQRSFIAEAIKQTTTAQGAPLAPAFDPLESFKGERAELKFREPAPGGLQGLLQRQNQRAFDSSKKSPLLQIYFGDSQEKVRRKHEYVSQTAPVGWCVTGGVDTYRHKEIDASDYDRCLSERKYRKAQFATQSAEEKRNLEIDIARLERMKRKMKIAGRRQNRIQSAKIMQRYQY